MNICPNAIYKIKQTDKNGVSTYAKNPHTFEQLKAKYSMSDIKQFLITKAVIIQECGKCEYCLAVKKSRYKKKVKAQYQLSKYNYLVTITMNDKHIDTLLTENQRESVLEYHNMSSNSNLSKKKIANIIRNFKYKFNKYYNEKVNFNYFLCGEYGENTDRAHYHLLFMMDRPIPELKREPVKGDHYKSKLFETKQFDLYDIQPADGNLACSSYISKYLTKQNDFTKGNYNSFEMEQIEWIREQDEIITQENYVLKSKDYLPHLLNIFNSNNTWYTYYYFLKKFNFDVYKFQSIKKQRPFIKQSRGLGISGDIYQNLQNGTINRYYRDRYIYYQNRLFNQMKWDDHILLNIDLIFQWLYYEKTLQDYDNKRRRNILNGFYKNQKSRNEKYKNNDVF